MQLSRTGKKWISVIVVIRPVFPDPVTNHLRPLSGSILFRLYCGFILPIFDYCDTVWSPPTALLSKSMERIHVRFVGHMSDVLSFVKATLAERRHFHIITKFYIFLYLPTFRICLCFQIL